MVAKRGSFYPTSEGVKEKKNGCTNAEIVAIPTEDVSLREVM